MLNIKTNKKAYAEAYPFLWWAMKKGPRKVRASF